MAVIEGVDYSFSRPSIPGLKAAGKHFACRYLSHNAGKNITQLEADTLLLYGIAPVANWEATAGAALNGRSQGVEDAQYARDQVHAIHNGRYDLRPIYFSVDKDIASADMPTVAAYFDGVASVIGLNRTGAYGGYRVIKYLFDHGKIKWGWQTYAWSTFADSSSGSPYLHWDKRAHIQQYRNNVTVAGGACDLDRAVVADFGQWGYQEADVALAADERQWLQEIHTLLIATTLGGNGEPAGVDSENQVPLWVTTMQSYGPKLDNILAQSRSNGSTLSALSSTLSSVKMTLDNLSGATSLTDADRQALAELKASVDALAHQLSSP